MSQDRSGSYTLAFIIFGFIASLVLIFGTAFYSIARRVKQEPAAVQGAAFPLSAADLEPFLREAPKPEAAAGTQTAATTGTTARRDRPLRLGAPIRGSLGPLAVMQAQDARLELGAPRPEGGIEWVRLDSRLQRYEALARGEVDLIWDTLGSLAEELPRLEALGLEARVVLWLGSGDPADAIVTDTRPDQAARRGRHAAVEAFSAAHLIALEHLINANLSPEEKAARYASLLLVGSPEEALAQGVWEEGGTALAVGTGSSLVPKGALHRETARAPFLNVEVLVAHPRLLEEGQGTLSALLARWSQSRRVPIPSLHQDLARVFELESGDDGRLSGPLRVPTAAEQQRFFDGAGAEWLDASSRVWLKLGLMRKGAPGARWFDAGPLRLATQTAAQESFDTEPLREVDAREASAAER